MALSHNVPIAACEPPGPQVLLGRLTASLAHNVNNALTGVIGYLELALQPEGRADTDACVRSGLECALQAADAVWRIVGCARRIEAAESPAPQSLRRLAEEAVERFRAAAPGASVTVVGATAGHVTVSAGLVAAALDFLLRSVVPAVGGALTLRLADEAGRSVLSIEGGEAGGLNGQPRLLEPSLLIEVQGGTLEILPAPDRAASLKLSFPRRGEAAVRRDEPQTCPPAPHLPAALGLLRPAV
jgi:hypothetical protein